MAAPDRHPGRIQVSSSKKPIFFYVNLSKRLLGEQGEIQLSALGQAVATLVSVTEILKKDNLALEKKLHTELDFSTEDGKPKPKMEIVLVKSPQFDEIIAAQAREAKDKEEPAGPPQEDEA